MSGLAGWRPEIAMNPFLIVVLPGLMVLAGTVVLHEAWHCHRLTEAGASACAMMVGPSCEPATGTAWTACAIAEGMDPEAADRIASEDHAWLEPLGLVAPAAVGALAGLRGLKLNTTGGPSGFAGPSLSRAACPPRGNSHPKVDDGSTGSTGKYYGDGAP